MIQIYIGRQPFMKNIETEGSDKQFLGFMQRGPKKRGKNLLP